MNHPEVAAAGAHGLELGWCAAQLAAEIGIVDDEGGGSLGLALVAGDQYPVPACAELAVVLVADAGA